MSVNSNVVKINTIESKLLLVQSEIRVPKNQINRFGGYMYRSCEDILEVIKPLLVKHKLTLILTDEIIMVGDRYYVQATARLIDGAESFCVHALAREADVKKKMDVSQITGSASSYARKYALNGMFLIDDTRDADTVNNTNSLVDECDLLAIKLISENKLMQNQYDKAKAKYDPEILYSKLVEFDKSINTEAIQ